MNNFTKTLPSITSDLATELIKDPYNFDFIQLTDEYKERELKDALIENITKFLMELGAGFAYIGKEYKLKIGTKERYIDITNLLEYQNLTESMYFLLIIRVLCLRLRILRMN